MIDLAELQEACEWAGLASEAPEFGNCIWFEPGTSCCVEWHLDQNGSEDGRVAFLLRDWIDERVQELERSATGDPVKDQPKRDAFILGRDFLNSRVSGFSAIGAAECLIAMWKAAKVVMPGEVEN